MTASARQRVSRTALALVLGLAPWLAAGTHHHHDRCTRRAVHSEPHGHGDDVSLGPSDASLDQVDRCVACRYLRGAKGVEAPPVQPVAVERLGFQDPPRPIPRTSTIPAAFAARGPPLA